MSEVCPKFALRTLEVDFPFLISEFCEGTRVLWLGSGISRSVFDDLPTLLERALAELQSKMTDDSNCPWRKALSEIIALAPSCSPEISSPISQWQNKAAFLDQLTCKYAQVLNVRINLENSKNFAYDILNITQLYSDPTKSPDTEHRFIAMLIEEGVCSIVVTTNWDSLIEQAHSELAPSGSISLDVIVSGDDLLNSGGPNKRNLIKIHGCAKKSLTSPQYKKFMVATEPEIASWTEDPIFRPIREKISTTLRENPALFVGLSGQDFNLKLALGAPSLGVQHVSHIPPRVLFASKIGADQQTILERVYGTADYSQNSKLITDSASVPLFGKSLLGGLFIWVFLRKLQRIVDTGSFQTPWLKELAVDGITFLRSSIEDRYETPVNPALDWQRLNGELVKIVSGFNELYFDQRYSFCTKYRPLYSGTAEQLQRDLLFQRERFELVLLVFGLLLKGRDKGMWTISYPLDASTNKTACQVILHIHNIPTRLFIQHFAAAGWTGLEQGGFVGMDEAEATIIVYTNGNRKLTSRFHTESPFGPVEVWIADLITESTSDDTLVETLFEEFQPAVVSNE
jgi:hypothetical protein